MTQTAIKKKKLVSISKAAEILNVSIDTVRRWDKSGVLHSERPDGKNRYFSVEELENHKFGQGMFISEAAKKLNISASTLRRLEARGILKPERNGAGERVYTQQSLKNFLNSEYFLRQKQVEEKILEPFKEPEADEERILPASLEEGRQKVHGLLQYFGKVFYLSSLVLAILATTAVLIVIVITVFFLAAPETAANLLGYRYQPASNSLAAGQVLGARTQRSVGQSIFGKFLRPFSNVSLNIVKQVNPEVAKKITPTQQIQEIKDINDVFKMDDKGNIVPVAAIKLPDVSYLQVQTSATQTSQTDGQSQTLTIPLVGEGSAGGITLLQPDGTLPGLKVTQANLVPGSVTANVIDDGSITPVKLSDATRLLMSITKSITNQFSSFQTNTCSKDQILSWNGSSLVCSDGKSIPGITANVSNDSVKSEHIKDGEVKNADLADGAVTSSKISDGTITASDLSSTLTFGAGSLLDLSAVTHSTSAKQGLILPNVSSATPFSPTSGKGYVAFDTAGNQLIFYNGSSWSTVSGGGGGVTSLDGLTGVLTLANSAGSGTTITIDNASTTAKGIASFNSTNFSVSSGAVNTAQNINTLASPTFSGLTLSSFTSNGGPLYTNGSGVLAQVTAGTSSQCLLGGTTPSFGSCAAGAGSNWDVVGGVITPKLTSTLDFLLGSTATSSAKFAVLNINSGTPTATISATATGISLSASGTIQSLQNATLTIGGSTTGNIVLSPNNGSSGLVTANSNLNLSTGSVYQIAGTSVLSSTTLGTGVLTSSLTTVGALASGSIASGFGTIATANTITGTTINGTTAINTGASGGTNRIDSSGNLVNISAITASGAITFSGLSTGIGHFNSSGVLTSSAVNLANSDVTGILPTANGGSFWNSSSGALYPGNSTLDLLVGATSTASAKFGFINVAVGTPTATIAGNLTLDSAGVIQTTKNQTLTIGGASTGNIILSPNNGSSGLITVNSNLNISTGSVYQIAGTSVLSGNTLGTGILTSSLTTVGALATGSIASGFGTIATANTITGTTINGTTAINTGASGGTNRIDSSGNLVNISAITASGTITFSGLSTGIGHFNSSGVLTSSAVNLANSDVTGILPTANGGSFWNSSSGALYPGNSTLDLLVGATSTASAKFGFINVAVGTPTASVSANSGNNATLLTGLGNLATTNMQTLTLGGTTTGNIVIDSGSGVVNLADLTASRAIFTDASSNLASTGASSDLLNSLSDETGTGVAVFGTSPAITTSLTTPSTTFALVNTTATTVNLAQAATTLTMGATTGTATIRNATVDFSGGSATVSGNLTLYGAARTIQTTALNTLTIGGSTTGNIVIDSADWDIGATGIMTGIGAITSDGAISTTSTFTAGSGAVILTDATGNVLHDALVDCTDTQILKWATGGGRWGCAADATGSGGGGDNWWQLPGSGILSPGNLTVDLVVGGTATNSSTTNYARAGFLNINSGTPTASVSAGTAGGAFLNATGTLATTAKQTLTLGDINTGEVQIGTDATARIITIGNVTAGTGVNIDVGTGDFDIDAVGAGADVLIDAAGLISLDATGASSNFTVTGSGLNLTLEVAGGGAQVLAINSAGTGANAIDLNATGTGGGVTIDTTNGAIVITAAGAANGDILITAADTLLLDSAGVLELNSSAGIISIGNDAVSQNINLGTAGARTIAIGNTTSNTAITVNSGGTGDITLTPADDLLIGLGDDATVTAAGGSRFLWNNTTTANTENTTATAGVLGIAIDDAVADTASNVQQGLYIDFQVTNTADVNAATMAHRAVRIDFTYSEDSSADTAYALSINNANDAVTTTIDGLISLENNDTTNVSVTAGIDFLAGGAATSDFDLGIDFSKATFGTAELKFKNAGTLSETSAGTWTFDKSAAGTVVLVATDDDTNSALTIQSSGTGALTLNPTGTGQIVITTTNTSASALDINANGTVAGNAITLDTTDGGIALTAAGAANGDITLAATDDININGTAGSLVNVGTSAVAQTITIGAATSTDLALTDAQWSVTGAGAAVFVGVNSGSGLLQGTGGLTVTGAAVSLNASSNFGVNIATGTSTGAIAIGGNSNTVAIDSSDWDITTTGAMTGIGALTMDGNFSQTGSTTFGTGTGAISINGAVTAITDVDLSLAATENLVVTNTTQGAADLVSIAPTWTADNTADGLAVTTTYNVSASTSTVYGLNLVNADNAGSTGVIDALALFSNDQATETLADGVIIRHNAASGTLTDGLQIENTTAGGTITNAINIVETAGTITTGINLGAGLTTGIDANSNSIVNIGDTSTDITSTGMTLGVNLTLSGDASEGLDGGGLTGTDCDTAATSKLLYDDTTNKFSCGTDQNSGGATAWDAIADPALGAGIVMAETAQTMDWNTAATATTFDGLTITMTNDATTDVNTQRAFVVANLNDSLATGTLETMVQIDNRDINETVTNGLLVEQTGAGTMTNAIQIAGTAGAITSGILIADGAGTIATGLTMTGTFTNLIDTPNFDVNNAGNITVAAAEGLDTNAAGALELGKANATSVDLCNSAACDTINIGNLATTDADTITIGDALDDVSITDANWSITGAGALTVASCVGCGGATTKYLTADHAISSVTGTEVTSISTTLVAGTYTFEYYLLVQSATATVSPLYGINYTGTGTPVEWMQYADASATLLAALNTADNQSTNALGFGMAQANVAETTTSPNMGHIGGVGAINTNILVKITGILVATGADGILQLWHSSETASSTTIMAGSSLIIQKITAGADLAEIYGTMDTSIGGGDVVSLDASLHAGVKKSTKAYDASAFGIVSTSPSLTMGTLDDVGATPVMVAMSGRVPVKVTTENGPIKFGDLLTSSSTPGVAMRATKAGQIIGQAMTSFDGSGIGSVLAFIKTDYANGTKIADLLPGLSSGEEARPVNISRAVLEKFVTQQDALTNSAQENVDLSEIVTDRVAAGVEVITAKVITSEVNLDKISAATGKDIALNLTSEGKFIIKDEEGNTAISFDSEGNAFFKGIISADKVKANQIEGLEIFTDKISSLASKIAGIATQSAVLSASDSAGLVQSPAPESQTIDLASALKNIEVETAKVKLNMEVLGKLSANGFVVLGPAEFKEDTIFEKLATFVSNVIFKSDVEFLGNVKFAQQTTFQGETIFEKLVTFLANVIFKGKVTFEDVPTFNSDTAGFALIKTGADRVDVVFDKEYEKTPIVNASLTFDQTKLSDGTIEDPKILEKKIFDGGYQYVISQRTQKGFTIVVNKKVLDDVTFSWIALAVKDSKKFESAVIPTPTLTQTSIPSPTATPTTTPTLTPIPTSSVSATPTPTETPSPSPTP